MCASLAPSPNFCGKNIEALCSSCTVKPRKFQVRQEIMMASMRKRGRYPCLPYKVFLGPHSEDMDIQFHASVCFINIRFSVGLRGHRKTEMCFTGKKHEEPLDPKKKVQEQIELQLHQQYAENNNAYFSSIVVLLAAILSALSAFGYIYIRTVLLFSNDFVFICEKNQYTLDAMLLIAMASLLILSICYIVCCYQGVAQRKEQFMIDSIRRRYYGKEFPKGSDKVFYNDYHPYNKKNENIVQGLYGLFCTILLWCGVAILLLTIIKYVAAILFWLNNREKIEFSYSGLVTTVLFVLSCIILYVICIGFHYSQILKYQEVQKEFKDSIKPTLTSAETFESKEKSSLLYRIYETLTCINRKLTL